LDLDETLGHTWATAGAAKKATQKTLSSIGEMDKMYEFKLEGKTFWGLKRPYLSFFIPECFSIFDIVGVWTAGDEDYAKEMVSILFGDTQPHFVWARSQCTSSKGIYYKPLDKLFAAFPDLDRDNTLILDDREDVAKYNPELIAVIPSFKPKSGTVLIYDRALVSSVAFLRNALASGKALRY